MNISIGLALSGGGHKGLAHTGAMRFSHWCKFGYARDDSQRE